MDNDNLEFVGQRLRIIFKNQNGKVNQKNPHVQLKV